MQNRQISINGLSCEAALEKLCREINELRSELIREMSMVDGANVKLDDGSVLSEVINKINKAEV